MGMQSVTALQGLRDTPIEDDRRPDRELLLKQYSDVLQRLRFRGTRTGTAAISLFTSSSTEIPQPLDQP
jgi:hypothetical protein